ncbi:T9SS type A sorting domain-containing protein [Polaribacter sp. MED152]|uniref:T9SS type A sorting domain-containing protein n=1 Tax=Polaribacter sp. MED152 TaxID=313598 RepID=UPI000068CA1E|nr:T9SS type A sorting domain-containing protein [Polaribacter sp. MED152]EAQ43011.1 hypothetical protein MED152_09815 [Polaribacter sp. MED152]
MKKTLLLFCLILISALSYGQTQPVVHNATFNKIAKNSGSDCACSGWINKSVGDQGESSTKNSQDVVKLDDLESDAVYQEVAVEANSDYTLDLEYWFNDATTTTEYIEVIILKGSAYVSGYTPLYAEPATALQDDYGYETLAQVDDTNNHVARTTIVPPGNTDMNDMTQLTFNTGSETSIAIYIRAIGPYDASAHGDSGKDKGFMNGDTEVRIDNLVLANLGAASSSGNTVDPLTASAADWISYFNAFNVSDDAFAFGFQYNIPESKTTITSSSVTLQPNFAIWAAEASNAAWFDQNAATQTPVKYIEANSFVESSTEFNGEDLTFEGNVSSFNLDSNYKAIAFIKVLASDYSSTLVNENVEITATGDFSVTVPASSLTTGLVVQYGFSIIGVPADPANESALGSVVVGAKATASVDDVFASNLTVYPNPANSFVNISSSENISGVEVYNVIGKRVLQVTNVVNNSIDVSSLSKGMYILKIASGDSVATKKIIKN